MPNKKWENFFAKQGFKHIAGVDEAGRGPLAGPVVAAAVILPSNINIPGLDDSKKLKDKDRQKLFKIIQKKAVSIGVGVVDSKTIDRINIAQASITAMQMAVDSLNPPPHVLLIDGNINLKTSAPQKTIIKGDALCYSIAAASIIAKVVRDKIMDEYSKTYKNYNFKKHKGYGTEEHINEIKKFGHTEIHRKSFSLKRNDVKPAELLDFTQVPLIHFKRRR